MSSKKYNVWGELMKKSISQICCIISVSLSLFLLFLSPAIASQADAPNIAPSFTSKCNSLKKQSAKQKGSEDAVFVLWEAKSDQILGCSNAKDKEEELNEKLKLISRNKTALTEFLSFRDSLNLKDSVNRCLLYTSPSPRDQRGSRMPSSA